MSNKLECYIALSWKGQQGIHTLTYWAHSKFTKKMKSVPNNLECHMTLDSKVQGPGQYQNFASLAVPFPSRNTMVPKCYFWLIMHGNGGGGVKD